MFEGTTKNAHTQAQRVIIFRKIDFIYPQKFHSPPSPFFLHSPRISCRISSFSVYYLHQQNRPNWRFDLLICKFFTIFAPKNTNPATQCPKVITIYHTYHFAYTTFCVY